MPKLHKYVPSSSKDGFYIYAMHNGQNVTYQVTPIARRIFEKLGYGDKTEISGEMLYTLHRLRLIYTNQSGVEPPTSFDGITDQVNSPDSAKGDRKRFFNILLEEGNFDQEEQEDLDQYLKNQDIKPDREQNQSSKSLKGTWRPTSPTEGNLYRGTVDFFNDTGGYGFIDSPDLDEDVFYHMEEIGGRDIPEGAKLEFARKDTDDGPRATHVRLLDDDKPLETTQTEDASSDSKQDLLSESLDNRPPLEAFQEAEMYNVDLKITFLGTGGRWPTKERVPDTVLITRDSESFLFDVGEGTQRRMHQNDIELDIDAVFITSTDTAHIGGLGPLLKTLSLQGRTDPLKIYVPESGVKTIESLLEIYGEFDYPIEIQSVNDGVVYEGDAYTIQAFSTDSDGQRTGYSFEEVPRRGKLNQSRAKNLGITTGADYDRLRKGEVITIDDDTEVDPRHVVGDPTPGRHVVYTGGVSDAEKIPSVAENADVLIHEAAYVYQKNNQDKVMDHASGKLAGHVARKAGVNRLLLTGIAPRTQNQTDLLLNAAESEFKGKIQIANDGRSLSLSVPESAELSTATDSATDTPSGKSGKTVYPSDLTKGMYVQVEVDRGKSGKGLTKRGYVHIMDGEKYAGEQVVVKIITKKSGFVTAKVKESSPAGTVYQYDPNKPKSKKTKKKSKKKSSKKSARSRRKSSSQKRKRRSSNPFKGQSSKMRDLVRKKH